MIETHPFGYFAPHASRHLLLGSFTAKPAPGYDWFYSSARNQFWPILRSVYNLPLATKSEKLALFARLQMAITDIILRCDRKPGSSLDTNLFNITWNFQAIDNILKKHPIETIYFSSRFVEARFKRHFKYPAVNLITLPSPSPRYAAMSLRAKIDIYRHLLPKL